VEPVEIQQYQTVEGKVPFREWRASLDQKTKAIVDRRLTRLSAGSLGDFKHFDHILELRIDYGPGYRIYCGKKGQTWVLLLTGGSKRTQDRDIEKAKRYWEDFQKRSGPQRTL
jgi:putative addiction module killer protein